MRDSPSKQTLEKWIEQGAPKEITDKRFQIDYFQFQNVGVLGVRVLGEIKSGLLGMVDVDDERTKIDIGHGYTLRSGGGPLVPAYEWKYISEDERTVTYTSGRGQTLKAQKDFFETGWGMAMYIDWAVKDRATWNEHKKRLDPHTPERWPSDWNAYVKKMNKLGEELPLALDVGGFFGYLRNWMGFEKLLYMFYDDPALIEDMMDQIVYLETEVIKRTLKDIKVHAATFWEDMAYKSGAMISPAMVRKFMVPRYKKITDLLHSYGVDVIFLDSDGDLNELIPLWLESGINFIFPFEVAAHNDAVAIRKKYGEDLIIGGTIDKRALAKGKEATREEVMSKVPFLLKTGGYFPRLDHVVPTDVTFENYCYYINLMREVAGLEQLSFY